MSVTAEVGSNVTFDCVGQDNGDPSSVQYQWNTVNSIGRSMTADVLSGTSHLSSHTINNIQFTSNISGVWCLFGSNQIGGTLEGSGSANITLVG